ncbi:MAG: DNA primase [Candidatus Eisenbacteria bacterium]|nr:DNA primase [Candidatus Eisenbacteria bacterium]
MARSIPDELIDEIRSANDIVDVISERIDVKRAGRRYKARCPFHREKTPSFSIDPDKQLYYCFGCGAGGNVFTFLTEYDKIGFLDAVRELAERAGIVIPDGENARDEHEDPVYRVNAFATACFAANLKGAQGAPARAYIERRGLTGETVEAFRIGYAPPGWNGLLNAARAKGIGDELLEEAGLVTRKDEGSRLYDRFRNRLVFPLLAAGDRIVGFGARALGDDPAKYLNSPETRVYRKGRYVYGLAQARPEMRVTREAILVEGYMDVVSLFQAGFTNVVASSGTALTPEQARVIARYAKTVFVAYDGDDAGIAAAARAAETLVQTGLKVRVVALPEGADPDSYVKQHGPDALTERLAEGLDFIDFAVRSEAPQSPEDREAVARGLIETIAGVGEPIRADLMLEKLSDAMSIGRGALQRAYEDAVRQRAERRGRRERRRSGERDDAREPVLSAAAEAEKGLLAIALDGGTKAQRVCESVTAEDFVDPLARSIAELALARTRAGASLDAASLVDELENEDAADLLAEIAAMEISGEDGERLCDDYIRAFRRTKLQQEIGDAERAIRSAEMAGDEDALISSMALRQELARRLAELSAGGMSATGASTRRRDETHG